jgi:GTPase SAR1 family protein
MKKIAIVGTQGVGKTILSKGLCTYARNNGKTARLVSECVRDCPLPIHEGQGIDTTYWILARQIQAEMEATVDHPDYIICDRSVMDPLVYLLYNEPMLDRLSDELFSFAWKIAESYDKIFLIRPCIREITPDRFRSTDKEYQYCIHSLFMATMVGHCQIIDTKNIFAAGPDPVAHDGIDAVEFIDKDFLRKILE